VLIITLSFGKQKYHLYIWIKSLKNMKHFVSSSFKSYALVLVLISATLFSCKKDEREKFLGSYNVNEACTPAANFNYQMTVTESSGDDETVLLGNFGDFNNQSFTATVSESSLTIPNQSVSVNGTTVTVSGSGAINGSILTITYTYSVNGGSGNCTATCTKL
jgi:hypothetical protein